MKEHGVEVDHATLNRWVLKYVPQLDQAFRARKRPVGSSWRMDETYVRVKGTWKYLYRAVDKAGATVDFLLTAKRDRKAAHARLPRTAASPRPEDPQSASAPYCPWPDQVRPPPTGTTRRFAPLSIGRAARIFPAFQGVDAALVVTVHPIAQRLTVYAIAGGRLGAWRAFQHHDKGQKTPDLRAVLTFGGQSPKFAARAVDSSDRQRFAPPMPHSCESQRWGNRNRNYRGGESPEELASTGVILFLRLYAQPIRASLADRNRLSVRPARSQLARS